MPDDKKKDKKSGLRNEKDTLKDSEHKKASLDAESPEKIPQGRDRHMSKRAKMDSDITKTQTEEEQEGLLKESYYGKEYLKKEKSRKNAGKQDSSEPTDTGIDPASNSEYTNKDSAKTGHKSAQSETSFQEELQNVRSQMNHSEQGTQPKADAQTSTSTVGDSSVYFSGASGQGGAEEKNIRNEEALRYGTRSNNAVADDLYHQNNFSSQNQEAELSSALKRAEFFSDSPNDSSSEHVTKETKGKSSQNQGPITQEETANRPSDHSYDDIYNDQNSHITDTSSLQEGPVFENPTQNTGKMPDDIDGGYTPEASPANGDSVFMNHSDIGKTPYSENILDKIISSYGNGEAGFDSHSDLGAAQDEYNRRASGMQSDTIEGAQAAPAEVSSSAHTNNDPISQAGDTIIIRQQDIDAMNGAALYSAMEQVGADTPIASAAAMTSSAQIQQVQYWLGNSGLAIDLQDPNVVTQEGILIKETGSADVSYRMPMSALEADYMSESFSVRDAFDEMKNSNMANGSVYHMDQPVVIETEYTDPHTGHTNTEFRSYEQTRLNQATQMYESELVSGAGFQNAWEPAAEANISAHDGMPAANTVNHTYEQQAVYREAKIRQDVAGIQNNPYEARGGNISADHRTGAFGNIATSRLDDRYREYEPMQNEAIQKDSVYDTSSGSMLNTEDGSIRLDSIPEGSFVVNQSQIDRVNGLAYHEAANQIWENATVAETMKMAEAVHVQQVQQWLMSNQLEIAADRQNAITEEGILLRKANAGGETAEYRMPLNLVEASFAQGSNYVKDAYSQMETANAANGSTYTQGAQVYIQKEASERLESQASKTFFSEYSGHKAETASMYQAAMSSQAMMRNGAMVFEQAPEQAIIIRKKDYESKIAGVQASQQEAVRMQQMQSWLGQNGLAVAAGRADMITRDGILVTESEAGVGAKAYRMPLSAMEAGYISDTFDVKQAYDQMQRSSAEDGASFDLQSKVMIEREPAATSQGQNRPSYSYYSNQQAASAMDSYRDAFSHATFEKAPAGAILIHQKDYEAKMAGIPAAQQETVRMQQMQSWLGQNGLAVAAGRVDMITKDGILVTESGAGPAAKTVRMPLSAMEAGYISGTFDVRQAYDQMQSFGAEDGATFYLKSRVMIEQEPSVTGQGQTRPLYSYYSNQQAASAMDSYRNTFSQSTFEKVPEGAILIHQKDYETKMADVPAAQRDAVRMQQMQNWLGQNGLAVAAGRTDMITKDGILVTESKAGAGAKSFRMPLSAMEAGYISNTFDVKQAYNQMKVSNAEDGAAFHLRSKVVMEQEAVAASQGQNKFIYSCYSSKQAASAMDSYKNAFSQSTFEKAPVGAIIIKQKDYEAKIAGIPAAQRDAARMQQMQSWLGQNGLAVAAGRADMITKDGILVKESGAGAEAKAFRMPISAMEAGYISGTFDVRHAYDQLKTSGAEDGTAFHSKSNVFIERDTEKSLGREKTYSNFSNQHTESALNAYKTYFAKEAAGNKSPINHDFSVSGTKGANDDAKSRVAAAASKGKDVLRTTAGAAALTGQSVTKRITSHASGEKYYDKIPKGAIIINQSDMVAKDGRALESSLMKLGQNTPEGKIARGSDQTRFQQMERWLGQRGLAFATDKGNAELINGQGILLKEKGAGKDGITYRIPIAAVEAAYVSNSFDVKKAYDQMKTAGEKDGAVFKLNAPVFIKETAEDGSKKPVFRKYSTNDAAQARNLYGSGFLEKIKSKGKDAGSSALGAVQAATIAPFVVISNGMESVSAGREAAANRLKNTLHLSDNVKTKEQAFGNILYGLGTSRDSIEKSEKKNPGNQGTEKNTPAGQKMNSKAVQVKKTKNSKAGAGIPIGVYRKVMNNKNGKGKGAALTAAEKEAITVRQTSAIPKAVLNTETRAVKFGVRMASRMVTEATRQTEFGKGMRIVSDTAMLGRDVFAITVVNNARRMLARPLNNEMRVMIAQRAFYDRSLKDFKMYGSDIRVWSGRYVNSLNKELQSLGYNGIYASGKELGDRARKMSARVLADAKKNGWTPQKRKAYKLYQNLSKTGKNTTFSSRPKVRVSTLVRRVGYYIMRPIYRSSDVGKGLQTTKRITKGVTRSVTLLIKTAWKASVISYIAVQKSSIATAKLALKRAQTLRENANKAGVNAKRAQKLNQKASKLQKYGSKARKRGKKLDQRRTRFRGRTNRLRERISDPFGLRSRMRQMRHNMWEFMKKNIKPLGFVAKKLNPVSQAVSRVAAVAAGAVFSFLKYVAIVLGIVILFCCLATFVSSLLFSSTGAFDFNGQNVDYVEALTETLNDAWEEDLDKINSLTSDCESVSITYVDVMDSDLYADYTSEHDSFIQTTNSAEILSMTLVRYGLDLDNAEDEDAAGTAVSVVCNYAEKLYHGSHEISVNKYISYVEYVHTGEYVETGDYDEDGTAITEEVIETVYHYSATVTYTSYFFDDIFDCSLASSTAITSGSSGYNNYSGEVSTERDIYLALRAAGLSHGGACGVIGNMRTEDTSLDPTVTSSSGYYGICQWANGGATMKSWCESNGYDGTTLTGQVAYLVYELTTNYKTLYNLLCSDTYADNYDACAQFFMHGYERCINGSGTYDYWDVYSIYSKSSQYYGTLYQGKDKRVSYAAEAYATYDSIKDTWEDEVINSKVEAAVQLAIEIAEDDTYTYVWGADGPTSYDCSHFVHHVFDASGITFPYASTAYMSSTLLSNGFELVSDASSSSWGSARRGDIIVWNGHTAIYCGNNTIVHAASSSTGIVVQSGKTSPSSGSSHSFVGIYRYVGD